MWVRWPEVLEIRRANESFPILICSAAADDAGKARKAEKAIA